MEEPSLLRSKTAKDDATRENVRRDRVLPKWIMSSSETAEPSLAKDRTEIDAPRCMKSSTDRVAPNLEKLRNAIELPKVTTSNNAKDAPNRTMPNTAIADATRE
jgi:hypothetical protein